MANDILFALACFLSCLIGFAGGAIFCLIWREEHAESDEKTGT